MLDILGLALFGHFLHGLIIGFRDLFSVIGLNLVDFAEFRTCPNRPFSLSNPQAQELVELECGLGMNGFNWLCVLSMTWAITATIGCGPGKETSSSNSDAQTEIREGKTPEQVWQETVERYRLSKSYRDEAVLNLQYRLAGRWIEEYHPQSIQFDRERGINAKIFHSRITADQNRLTCFVFDSASGNLDNQVWLRSVDAAKTDSPKTITECWLDKWETLYADPIARHFVSGRSEIPLKDQSNAAVGSTFPLTMGLLLGTNRLGGWTQPDRVSWADVVEEDGSAESEFFKLRLEVQSCQHQVWIDRKSGTIVKVRFDPKVLDKRLNESTDVSDIQLELTLDKARLGVEIESTVFSTDLAKQAKPVHSFVKIPEAFPSRFVGSPVPEFDLKVDDRASVSSKLLKGQVNCLLFVEANYLQQDFLTGFLHLAEQFQGLTIRASVVFTGPMQVSKMVTRELGTKISSVGVYFDPDFHSAKALQLRQMPCLVVLDRSSKIQFFRVIDPAESVIRSGNQASWQQDLSTAIQRIDRGEDLATEMKQAYIAFLDDYQKRLASANPFPAENRGQLVVQPASSTKSIDSSVRVAWESPVEHAGRFLSGRFSSGRSKDLTCVDVLSGYRKIVRVDLKGNRIADYQLDLPEQVAVDRLSRYSLRDGRQWNVAYSLGGKQVHVFDENWKLLFRYPKMEKQNQRIRGVVLANLAEDELPELYIGWGGISEVHRINLASGNRFQTASIKSLDSLNLIHENDGSQSILCGT